MVVLCEKKDLIAASASFGGSWLLGTLSSNIVRNLFASGLSSLQDLQREVNDCYRVSTSMANSVGILPKEGSARILALQAQNLSDSSGWLSRMLNSVVRGVEVSGVSGARSSFWTGGIETFTSFWMAWKGREPQDMVVCVLNGGIRGSVLGLGIGISQGNSEARALRVIASAVIGFASGVIGSSVGIVTGRGARLLFQQSKGEVK